MHAGEVRTDAEQVHRLVADQFPEWAGLPVVPVGKFGTDHTLYRLGEELLVRMPRIDWAVSQAESDRRWLPVLAPRLPLPVPVPVATGAPGHGFPWQWSVVPWLPGEIPTGDNFDQQAGATDLAAFVRALQCVDTAGGPVGTGMMRGVPLAARDDITRGAIRELGDRIDRRGVTAAWESALSAEVWTRPGVWIHGDLEQGNLLVDRRRFSAVIDFGGLGVGDPAPDAVPAWSIFDASGRAAFRAALGFDEDTWQRARGWALTTALVGLPYYWETFPAWVAEAQRKIAKVLADPA